MKTRLLQSALVLLSAAYCSCNSSPSKNHGPIVLGDSSTIVTEDDPQRLKDLVTDLKPDIPPAKDSMDDKPAQAAPDTDKKQATAAAPNPPQQVQQSVPDVAGMKAEFKETAFLVPGLGTKKAQQNANGAVFTLNSGNVNGSTVKCSGNVTKVSMRYQSIVVYKSGGTTLPLDNLTSSTSWTPMKGGKDGYRVTGLDANNMEYADANNNSIRNAVTRAAQRHRINHKKVQELVNSVKNVREANQKPLIVTLRSVMWKIDGKDASGRPFSKQIRLDIPM